MLQGDPADAIATAAAGASLLVVGAETGGGFLTAPRIPARIAGSAECPVVIVPHDWSPTAGPIVVGSSVDSASEAATEAAATIAGREGRDLVLAHAWDLPVVGAVPPTPGGPESIPERQQAALEQLAVLARAQHPGIRVRIDLRHGPAARSLADAAEGAGMLVVGRRDRSAAARRVLGSVSHEVVTQPPCPVLVVPAPEPGLRVTPETLPEDL